MKFLDDNSVFFSETAVLDGLIIRENRLPAEVFRSQMCGFLMLDFDRFQFREYFTYLARFVEKVRESRFRFACLDPDPVAYYYQHFRKYPFAEMLPQASPDDYVALLRQDPDGSPADALAYRADVIVFYSHSKRWVVYGERELSLIVVGFQDESLVEAFLSSFDRSWLLSAEDAVENILPLVFGDPRNMTTRENIGKTLVLNYGGQRSVIQKS